VFDAIYQAEKARKMQVFIDKLERDKAVIKHAQDEFQKYKDDSMYHTNVWLYGHTPESLRNNEAWLLAEQEEA
jgi:hypothetical protein